MAHCSLCCKEGGATLWLAFVLQGVALSLHCALRLHCTVGDLKGSTYLCQHQGSALLAQNASLLGVTRTSSCLQEKQRSPQACSPFLAMDARCHGGESCEQLNDASWPSLANGPTDQVERHAGEDVGAAVSNCATPEACPSSGASLAVGGTVLGIRRHSTIEWFLSYCCQLCQSRRLFMLVVWWITMQGPVLIFLESYGPNLFQEINPEWESNGHAIAASSMAMAVAAAAAPSIFQRARGQSYMLLVGTTLAAAVTILVLSVSQHVVVAYALNALAAALLRLQLCIVQGTASALLDGTEYASLFAVNAFLSLVLQSAFQVCCSSCALRTALHAVAMPYSACRSLQ
jgi:hypothetical protein